MNEQTISSPSELTNSGFDPQDGGDIEPWSYLSFCRQTA